MLKDSLPALQATCGIIKLHFSDRITLLSSPKVRRGAGGST